MPEPELPRVPDAVPAQLVTVTRVGRRRLHHLDTATARGRMRAGGRQTPPGPPRTVTADSQPGTGQDIESPDVRDSSPEASRLKQARRHFGRTGSSRHPVLLVAGAALLVALAMAKPWAWGTHGSSAAAAAVAASSASPRAGVSPGDGAVASRPAGDGATGFVGMGAPWDGSAGLSVAADQDSMTLGGTADPLVCMPPAGWRIVVDGPDPTRPGSWVRVSSRSWLPVVPVRATGPADAGIPFVRAPPGGITVIGVCAASPALRGRRVTIWRLVASNPAAGPSPRAILVAGLPVPAGADGVLLLPLLGGAGCGATPIPDGCLHLPAWPPGRYVLEISSAVTGTTEWWMGLELARGAP